MKLGKNLMKTAEILLGVAVLAGGVLGYSREVKAVDAGYTEINNTGSGKGTNLEWKIDGETLTIKQINPNSGSAAENAIPLWII